MNAGKFAITVVTAMMLLTTGVSAMTMPGYGMGSTEDDAIIMTESETSGFNTYYNSAYGYALDIPAAASEAEATSKGEGCYFEDPDTHAVISVYATRNMMQLTADQLYRMARLLCWLMRKRRKGMSFPGRKRIRFFMRLWRLTITARIPLFLLSIRLR